MKNPKNSLKFFKLRKIMKSQNDKKNFFKKKNQNHHTSHRKKRKLKTNNKKQNNNIHPYDIWSLLNNDIFSACMPS